MKIQTTFSTRNPHSSGRKLDDATTEYQLHRSQIGSGDKFNLFDYSEYRLMLYCESLEDPIERTAMEGVAKQYRRGDVALAWKSGRPIWINVVKESKI